MTDTIIVTPITQAVTVSSSGPQGATGATGSSGVVSVTAPVTNSGTSTAAILGLDQTALAITPSQVTGTAVITTDSRLSNARTPLAHADSHASAGSDPVTLAQSQVTNLTTDLANRAILNSANTFSVGGHIILNAATAVVPLAIRQIAGQSADLLQIQNSGSAAVSSFGNTGNLKIRTVVEFSSALNVATASTAQIGAVIRGIASQSANLQEWQNSGGTVIARVLSDGSMFSSSFTNNNGRALIGENNSGGTLRLERATAAQTNPGANLARLYFRDGTTTGTLKLVVRAGAAGAETTILDNIPQ